jgi:UDPglucose 6-dehydrogenase
MLRKKEDYHVVVVKSTVVPGTTEEVIIPILERYSGKKAGIAFGVAVNPEFLRAGRALDYFLSPDRIIIGEYDQRSGDVLSDGIYRDFASPILRTDLKTAEMIKCVSNTFLSTKISFINEIGNICKKLGIDVYTVAQGMGYAPRIGNQFLSAGVGFGGPCLPKDLDALASRAKEVGYEAQLLEAVSTVNKTQPLRITELVRSRIGGLENKKIAVLGLAFKPHTDDIREAPALRVIAQLLHGRAIVKAYDPQAMQNAKQVFPQGVEYCGSAREAVEGSDCILILTEWDEFKDEELYRGKLVVDGRRVLDPRKARNICNYEGICW